MATDVRRLTMAQFLAVDTRNKIHELTDQPDGPTFAEREAFAALRGQRNVVKYWPWQVVLEACWRWGIEPVLTQQGTALKKQGGFEYATDERDSGAPPERKVEPRGQEVPKPVGGQLPQGGDAEAERQRKLNALNQMIRDEIEKVRGKDDDMIKETVAAATQAAVGAVLATKGGELLHQMDAMGKAAIAEAVKKIDEARPVTIFVKVGDKPEVELGEHTHKVFGEVLQLAAAGMNIALVGPTGCGKTKLSWQVAKALQREFGTVSCTMGMSETKIVGGWLPTGEGGKFEAYVGDMLVKARDGGVFLLDEFDSADPNVALIINQLLANGRIDVPGVGPIIAHKNFVCIAALNTYGTGADRQYVGRSQLDEATLDRFRVGLVEMDYDTDLEQKLITNKKWLERAWQIRKAMRDNRMRRNMSTRFMLDGQKMMASGWSEARVLGAFTAGWSPDDKAKIGVK